MRNVLRIVAAFALLLGVTSAPAAAFDEPPGPPPLEPCPECEETPANEAAAAYVVDYEWYVEPYSPSPSIVDDWYEVYLEEEVSAASYEVVAYARHCWYHGVQYKFQNWACRKFGNPARCDDARSHLASYVREGCLR